MSFRSSLEGPQNYLRNAAKSLRRFFLGNVGPGNGVALSAVTSVAAERAESPEGYFSITGGGRRK